jgi:hypothetical protein
MHQNPIEMSAEHKNQGGDRTLEFVGKREADFLVVDPDAPSRIENRCWPSHSCHP